MLSISYQGGGYNIKVSWPGTGQRGYSVHAKDLDAIHKAIDHYYAPSSGHAQEPAENCPFCQKRDRK